VTAEKDEGNPKRLPHDAELRAQAMRDETDLEAVPHALAQASGFLPD
jgi:hypothetical protein